MDTTPNLILPYLAAAQSQKHVTHNEAIRALDALVQIAVLDRDLAAPPQSPANGDRYIVAAAPTGAWAGHAGKIAAWQDNAWMFFPPREGWVIWIADEDALVVFDGAAYSGPALQNAARLGIATTADATNKLAVASAASLFTHGGAGHTLKINKNAAANDAALILQSGFSARALMGLLGDDHFTVKTSADGAAYQTAFTCDKTTGAVEHTAGAKFEAQTNFENYVAANTWTKVQFNTATHNDQNAFVAGSNSLVAPTAGYYLVGAQFRFKANATVPASVQIQLYRNTTALDRTLAASHGTVVTLRTTAQASSVLKLAAGDAIDVRAFMETNDGYVDDAASLFYGARIA